MISREEKNKELQDELIWQERKEKYSKVILRILKISFWIFFFFFSSFLLLRYVGTNGLIVKEYGLSYHELPTSFSGLKIVHFSDLHFGNYLKEEQVTNVINQINRIHPDIIVFTGDLVDNDYPITEEEIEFLIQSFNHLETTIGKFSVKGEVDGTTYQKVISNTDFIELTDDYQLIYRDKNIPIVISGVDSTSSTFQNRLRYFEDENADSSLFHIVLTHEPDVVDSLLEKYSINLVLAGHSHNGQIVLPYIGGILRKNGAKNYYKPYYHINQCDLYISSGIGSSPYPYRFLNHPSINFYRIRSN